MWNGESFLRAAGGAAGGLAGAMGHLGSKSAPCSPVKPFQKRTPAQPDSFHVIHKVPLGDSPYVKAKHVQLVDKDPDAAIALFWAAINAGDRVDSALKDMAIVMKQQNRPEEAIEAIKSLRYRCSDAAQESLDNVLLDLYKRCGRLDDQIALLKHKLHLIHQGMAFNGKRTKTARSQGKKFQVSIEQEATRLLGNLGWAYMQQSNFLAAEAVYRKALSIGPDNNKVCNLGICLMKQGRLEEAKAMLQSVVPACPDTRWGSDSHLKSYERAQEMLVELEASMVSNNSDGKSNNILQPAAAAAAAAAAAGLWQPQELHSSRGAAAAAEVGLDSIMQFSLPQYAGALSATAGFGPALPTRPVSQKKLGTSAPGSQQQLRDGLSTHEIGGGGAGPGGPGIPGGNNSSDSQFISYHHPQHHQQSSSFSSSVWDDYEPGYASPDENVDTNVRQRGMSNTSNFQQQQQQQQMMSTHWPGESLRQKQESFSAILMDRTKQQQQQPLSAKKLERSLTFGGALSRVNGNGNSYSNNSSFSSDSAPPATAPLPPPIQRTASENFTGKVYATSPLKPGGNYPQQQQQHGDTERERTRVRAPLTYDRTNAVSLYAGGGALQEENAAAKQITSGWDSNRSNSNDNSDNKSLPGHVRGVANAATLSLKSPLGNSELSFFSRWGYNENRPTNATRRSLSLESFDMQLEQIALENAEEELDDDLSFPFSSVPNPPLPMHLHHRHHQAAAAVTATAAAAVGGHVKRPRNQTPVKEKNSSSSLWNSMGFTICPDGAGLAAMGGVQQQLQYDTEEMKHMNSLVSQVVSEATATPTTIMDPRVATTATAAALAGPPPPPAAERGVVHMAMRCTSGIQQQQSTTNAVPASTDEAGAGVGPAATAGPSGGDAEMIKRQRRLRVFQEITLFPGSPQQVGV